MQSVNGIDIRVATREDLRYIPEIIGTIEEASKSKGTGIASRESGYIEEKILQGKAVIATCNGEFVGFCYIETWEHGDFVANSGLVVKPQYRGKGIAAAIKARAFERSRELFPKSKVFGLTTAAPVMKINSSLGYRPVTYDALTADPLFWKGCEGCRNYDILERTGYKCCLCTGMLYDPWEEAKDRPAAEEKKKVVVCFSGGLDTCFTVMYLARQGYEVYAACADTGGFSAAQLEENEKNAYRLGAKEYVTLDIAGEYYEKCIRYMVYGNVLRGGTYPISVSSERVFQALAVAKYARQVGASAIAHGSTAAGNDQVRFDSTFLVAAPGMKIITLTRDMGFTREFETDYLKRHGFDIGFSKKKYSYNIGLWGTSVCGGETLDSEKGLPESAYLKQVTKSGSEVLSLEFREGQLTGVNSEPFSDPVAAIRKVESIASAYGIGRDMHVGDTIIGIKGRVGFEAAAPLVIIAAHKYLEKFTLSKWQQYWKDQVSTWYGMFLHEAQYLEPVMRDIEKMLESSQRHVNGTVTMELRPYCFNTLGVDSPDDLVNSGFGQYGEEGRAWTAQDAKGFIKMLSNPLEIYYSKHPEEKDD